MKPTSMDIHWLTTKFNYTVPTVSDSKSKKIIRVTFNDPKYSFLPELIRNDDDGDYIGGK